MAKKRDFEEDTHSDAQVEPAPEPTIAVKPVRRFHKKHPSRVFQKGDTIPADWSASAEGMNTATAEDGGVSKV